MADFTGKFDSAKQDWETPDEVFARMGARRWSRLSGQTMRQSLKTTLAALRADNETSSK